MGPPSSHLLHWCFWRKPGAGGSVGTIILTPLAPPSPRELLGGLSPAEILPEVSRENQQLSSHSSSPSFTTSLDAGGKHWALLSSAQLAQAQPSSSAQPPRAAAPAVGLPMAAPSCPGKSQPLPPAHFGFLSLWGWFLPAFPCSWERPEQDLPFQREKPREKTSKAFL